MFLETCLSSLLAQTVIELTSPFPPFSSCVFWIHSLAAWTAATKDSGSWSLSLWNSLKTLDYMWSSICTSVSEHFSSLLLGAAFTTIPRGTNNRESSSKLSILCALWLYPVIRPHNSEICDSRLSYLKFKQIRCKNLGMCSEKGSLQKNKCSMKQVKRKVYLMSIITTIIEFLIDTRLQRDLTRLSFPWECWPLECCSGVVWCDVIKFRFCPQYAAYT